jgi:diguanylate cyclase
MCGALPLPRSNSEAEPDIRAARRLRSVKRAQGWIAAAYLYDSLVVLGFYRAGFVAAWAPLGVGAALALVTILVAWAHQSGWSRRLKDPTLFLPQQLYAIAVALGTAAAAPQIAFQPFATLFAICAFSFMAPNSKSLVVGWAAAALGAVGVIFLCGPQLAMPTSTFAGEALTSAVVIGLLARCLAVAVFFRGLQRRLGEKNAALKAAIERIEVLANRDELTGLANRRSIAKWLGEQMAQCDRSGLPLTVALLDIDHFKQINDTYGHSAGDRTLQLFANCVSEMLQGVDRLGRYGGEEFLVVLVATSLNNAEGPLERIRSKVAACDWSAIDANIHLTLTIGATDYARGESAEDLLRRADLALYLGKESGRDRVVLSRTPIKRIKAA